MQLTRYFSEVLFWILPVQRTIPSGIVPPRTQELTWTTSLRSTNTESTFLCEAWPAHLHFGLLFSYTQCFTKRGNSLADTV